MPDGTFVRADLEAVWRALPAADTIYLAGCTGAPMAMLAALGQNPELAHGRTFTGVWIPGVNAFDPTQGASGAQADVYFMTPNLREGFGSGRVRHLPLSYSSIWARLRAHASSMTAIMTVTPPVNGYVGLGPATDFTPALAENGARLIGEINPRLPEPVHGYRIPVDRFETLVEAEAETVSYDAGATDATFEVIAQTIADMIDDGDTVQFGLGKVQAAVLPKLSNHRGLGFHGGMVSTPMVPLLEAGVFDKGVVTGVALGSQTLYDSVCKRDDVRFLPVSHTHNAGILAGIDRLVSVASALEIDLFGQVNAETVGGRQVSGHGGIAEFARGAMASKGGRSIVALPSTAKKGTRSRIRLRLDAEVVCSIPRSDVDVVVTEYGVAELRGADIDKRAHALVSIAHPEFRDELANGWSEARRRM